LNQSARIKTSVTLFNKDIGNTQLNEGMEVTYALERECYRERENEIRPST
jgi:hypothetical protein